MIEDEFNGGPKDRLRKYISELHEKEVYNLQVHLESGLRSPIDPA